MFEVLLFFSYKYRLKFLFFKFRTFLNNIFKLEINLLIPIVSQKLFQFLESQLNFLLNKGHIFNFALLLLFIYPLFLFWLYSSQFIFSSINFFFLNICQFLSFSLLFIKIYYHLFQNYNVWNHLIHYHYQIQNYFFDSYHQKNQFLIFFVVD